MGNNTCHTKNDWMGKKLTIYSVMNFMRLLQPRRAAGDCAADQGDQGH